MSSSKLGEINMEQKELIEEIKRLKKEKNAVIIAHYYQNAEIQDIADFVGDSLALSQIASKTSADIIVFCGVHFMAETAKILSPQKKVLLPVMKASCFMAKMMDEVDLAKYKEANPDTKIICYVNSTAKVKALADCCVTSSNALKIIEYYAKNNQKMLYCPDQNLGKYAISKYGYDMEVWSGYCPIHHFLKVDNVIAMKKKYPNALFIAHPECQLDILEKADYIGSTKQLIEYVKQSPNKEFIIGTEKGVIHKMELECPDKKFYLLANSLVCQNMKLSTLEDVYNVLNTESNEIVLDEDIIKKARVCLDKMLELSK